MGARFLVMRLRRVRVLNMRWQKHLTVPVLAIDELGSNISRSVGLLIGSLAKRAYVSLAVQSPCLRWRVVKFLHEGVASI